MVSCRDQFNRKDVIDILLKNVLKSYQHIIGTFYKLLQYSFKKMFQICVKVLKNPFQNCSNIPKAIGEHCINC